MKEKSAAAFFEENERRVNRIVVRIFSYFVFVGPLLFLGRRFGIFPLARYGFLTSFSIVFIAICVFLQVVLKKFSNNRKAKYVVLSCVEMMIFFISTTPGVSVFIAYVIVPIISCFYYNKRFTRHICVSSYIIMLVSLYIRSTMSRPVPVPVSDDRMRWFIAYGMGSSLEYLFCISLVNLISQRMRETMQRRYEQDVRIKKMQRQLIIGFAGLVESKDHTTGEHITRTSDYVNLIAHKLRDLGYYQNELSDEQIETMTNAAPLHDLGKISVPETILEKNGKLTAEERAVIERHPADGAQLIEQYLSDVEEKEYTKMAKEMTLGHHEWWNGKGYPRHVSGTDIPLSARIMAAADVLDALLNVRPYKKAFSVEETFGIIRELSGAQFDPCVVEAVEALRPEIEAYVNASRGAYIKEMAADAGVKLTEDGAKMMAVEIKKTAWTANAANANAAVVKTAETTNEKMAAGAGS